MQSPLASLMKHMTALETAAFEEQFRDAACERLALCVIEALPEDKVAECAQMIKIARPHAVEAYLQDVIPNFDTLLQEELKNITFELALFTGSN